MKVMSTFILEDYVSQYPETKNNLLAWLHDIQIRKLANCTEILNDFPRAISLREGDEFSFEIKEDGHYLLAAIHYSTQIVSIKTIGVLGDTLPTIYNLYRGIQKNGSKTR